jgi:hypothetical protein
LLLILTDISAAVFAFVKAAPESPPLIIPAALPRQVHQLMQSGATSAVVVSAASKDQNPSCIASLDIEVLDFNLIPFGKTVVQITFLTSKSIKENTTVLLQLLKSCKLHRCIHYVNSHIKGDLTSILA